MPSQFQTILSSLANILQPVVAYILFMYVSNVSKSYKIVASVIIACYAIFMLIRTCTMYRITCVKASCDHLAYGWWNKLSGFIYITALITISILLIRPVKFMILFVAYILVTLTIALLAYTKSVASMWCWFAAFAPIVTGLFYWISTK